MAYCPKCKKTFSDSSKECPDCHLSLCDDSAIDIPMVLLTSMEDDSLSLKFMDFLEENGIHDFTMSESDEKNSMDIFVSEKQLERSKKLLNSFLLEYTGDINDYVSENEVVSSSSKKPMSERYEETKSSAITFLSVGILGLLFSAACLKGILQLPLSTFSLWILFIICIASVIYGIICAANIKKYRIKAESETSMMDECRAWCKEHLKADQIDASIPGILSEAEEARYFKRMERMKSMIHKQFPDFQPELLDEFCDGIYETIF